MENKKDLIGFDFGTVSNRNIPKKWYSEELSIKKQELQDKINNLVESFEAEHKVVVKIERDVSNENRYHIWLIIDLDYSIF